VEGCLLAAGELLQAFGHRMLRHRDEATSTIGNRRGRLRQTARVAVGTRQAIEPPASRWAFPDDPAVLAEAAGAGEVVGIGADLEPGTLLAAYRCGLFPMPARRGVMAWWSPNPRGILPFWPGGLRVSRSLRKSCTRFEIRVDTAFDAVLAACADRRRPGAWIDRDIRRAYRRLHELGWVHSVESWDDRGELAGGLYGVAIGGLFAGESMFHRQTDASKVALVGLVSLLVGSRHGERRDDAGRPDAAAPLLDIQWATPHLASLGAIQVGRDRYHELLRDALTLPQPTIFGGGDP
jgi:leucyl/phenylalanyl-tRNA--protein transferase